MKSKLFQEGSPKGFLDHAKLLATIPVEAFADLISTVEQFAKPDSLTYSAEDLLPVARSTGIKVDDLLSAMALAAYILLREKDAADSIEDILDDLVSSGTVGQEEIRNFREKIEIARPFFTSKLDEPTRARADIKSTFPFLEHLHTRCSAIARFQPEYNPGRDSASSYLPNVVKLTPVVFVQMDVGSYGATDFEILIVVDFFHRPQSSRRRDLRRCASDRGSGLTMDLFYLAFPVSRRFAQRVRSLSLPAPKGK